MCLELSTLTHLLIYNQNQFTFQITYILHKSYLQYDSFFNYEIDNYNYFALHIFFFTYGIEQKRNNKLLKYQKVGLSYLSS